MRLAPCALSAKGRMVRCTSQQKVRCTDSRLEECPESVFDNGVDDRQGVVYESREVRRQAGQSAAVPDFQASTERFDMPCPPTHPDSFPNAGVPSRCLLIRSDM